MTGWIAYRDIIACRHSTLLQVSCTSMVMCGSRLSRGIGELDLLLRVS